MQHFGQVHRCEGGERQGTGLGLPLTNRLVEIQGGQLVIESEPDSGTLVKIVFPPEKVVTPA